MFTRLTKFGFPSKGRVRSDTTVRMVPLLGVARQDAPPQLLPPGSSVSMTNFLPVGADLRTRSRLSSLLTANPFVDTHVSGFGELVSQGGSESYIWVTSGATLGQINTGGFSKASFVSSAGVGASAFSGRWTDFALSYSPGKDQTFLAIASSSYGTLVAAELGPVFSHMTQAPQARYVASFDHYLLAFNVRSGGSYFETRIQWSDRGDPFNWTAGGSSNAGFEDLVSMRGRGTGVKVLDNRLILFSDLEIWVGVPSTYPAQFQFVPLYRGVGCPYPRTIQETRIGLIFLGNDDTLYLLPIGESIPVPIAAGLVNQIRLHHRKTSDIDNRDSWGLYLPEENVYLLWLYRDGTLRYNTYVVNLENQTWGRLDYGDAWQTAGIVSRIAGIDGFGSFSTTMDPVFTGDRNGQVYLWSKTASLDSNTGSGSGVVTARWQSQPAATDLPPTQKLVTALDFGYRTQSASTATVKLSQDFGHSFEATGKTAAFPPASIWSRTRVEHYHDSVYPVLEITSESTGLTLMGPIAVNFRTVGRE